MKRELSSLTSSPLKEGDTKYSSRSPVKPLIELERNIISVINRKLEK
ncbi:MAG: hypothetical protein RRB18_08295 [Sulfolobaceae archaeon]|nr:hypothetical protein [Sulfolobaceae archaeon]